MNRLNQYERTHRDIINALFSLMEKKNLDKILVGDITDEAMVNRSTFYQHFKDKYDILEQLQKKYIDGMTARIDEIVKSRDWDLAEINHVMCDYLAENRVQIRKLLTIRSESLDLEGQMRQLFDQYMQRTGDTLSTLESDILAGMLVSFFVHFLKNDFDGSEISERMMTAWVNMNAYFFRIDGIPQAKERFLRFVASLHGEAEGQSMPE